MKQNFKIVIKKVQINLHMFLKNKKEYDIIIV